MYTEREQQLITRQHSALPSWIFRSISHWKTRHYLWFCTRVLQVLWEKGVEGEGCATWLQEGEGFQSNPGMVWRKKKCQILGKWWVVVMVLQGFVGIRGEDDKKMINTEDFPIGRRKKHSSNSSDQKIEATRSLWWRKNRVRVELSKNSSILWGFGDLVTTTTPAMQCGRMGFCTRKIGRLVRLANFSQNIRMTNRTVHVSREKKQIVGDGGVVIFRSAYLLFTR